MQAYELTLKCDVSDSFRCVKAANSLDIDVEKKSEHHFKVSADIDTAYSVGLIVGASGSGKTTFARHVFGEDCFSELLDSTKPIIEQFPESYSYDECAAMLCGVGLTSVPCWIRPAATLSNGQKARAEAALQMASQSGGVTVIDEWTSVVDRTIAKVMSHCIQKHARRSGRKIVLLSCHYDVIEWLNPDWVIDCNKQEFIDRRLLCREFKRSEQLKFEIRQIDKTSWKYFSRYHYLSAGFPGGHTRYFGLFHGDEQIGFQCFANYVPCPKGTIMKMHSNRTVIHPDYCGLGLGILLINETSAIMVSQGFEVWAKSSSIPIYRARVKSGLWDLVKVERLHKGKSNATMKRKTGFRVDVKTWSFRFRPDKYAALHGAANTLETQIDGGEKSAARV